MAEEQTNPENSDTPQDSGNEGGEKLIFGKYKTLEEAEHAHKELERGFHSKAQEASQWREIASKAPRQEPIADEYGSAGRYVPYAQPAPTAPAADQVLTQFYQDPIGTLENVRRSAVREAAEMVEKRNAKQQELAQRLQRWSGENQDVLPHADLLTAYVAKTDGRLAPETRLDLAAAELRRTLNQLRGKQTSEIKPENFVDAPGGNRDGTPVPHTPEPQASNGEADLAKYAMQRSTARVKPLGMNKHSG